MLLTIYVLVIILGFSFLGLGIYLGSYAGNDKNDQNDTKKEVKLIVPVAFLILSCILFVIAAFNSMSVMTDTCENQVTQTVLTGNTTTYTNQISCTTQRHSDQGVAGFLSFMAVFSLVMTILVTVNSLR